MSQCDDYYSWVPNNSGTLVFKRNISPELLGTIFNCKVIVSDESNEIRITKLQINDNITTRIKNIRTSLNVTITFQNIINNSILKGKIIFKHNIPLIRKILKKYDFLRSTDNILFQVNYTVYSNGKIKFYNSFSELDLDDTIYEMFKLASYTTIKKVIHMDNHHIQKVDTFIGLYNNFDPKIIFKRMLQELKKYELFLKKDHINHCYLNNEILHKAKGYKTYLDSFAITFNIDQKLAKQSDNIVESATQIVNFKESKLNYTKAIISMILVFIGLFTSSNLMLNSFNNDKLKDSYFIENLVSYSEYFISQNIDFLLQMYNRDIIMIFNIIIISLFMRKYAKKYSLFRYDTIFYEFIHHSKYAPKTIFIVLTIIISFLISINLMFYG